MRVYKGGSGLKKTQQDEFPEKVVCHKCGGNAHILFVAHEDKEKEYLCRLRPESAESWLHDTCSVAVYLCTNPECWEVNGLINQA